jgi:hypothetical protein
MPSGNLRYRIGFYQRGGSTPAGSPPPPDYGSGPGYPTTATFVVWGNIDPRPGNEQVIAARLTGKNFVSITVRQSSATDQVDNDWICKNEDSGELYNIRSVIDPQQANVRHGFFWEIIGEKGVAT